MKIKLINSLYISLKVLRFSICVSPIFPILMYGADSNAPPPASAPQSAPAPAPPVAPSSTAKASTEAPIDTPAGTPSTAGAVKAETTTAPAEVNSATQSSSTSANTEAKKESTEQSSLENPETATSASEVKSELKPISDVDFSILNSPPQFIWGFNAFLRKPGFAMIDPSTDLISPDKFSLEAILFDPVDPVAIINEQTVGLGDKIEGMEVDSIGANYVVLRGQGLLFELALPPVSESAHAIEIQDSPPVKEKLK